MSHKRSYRLLFLLSVLTAGYGCYRTRIDVGGGPLASPANMNAAAVAEAERWRVGSLYHDAVLGLVDLSGPLRLDVICPAGVDYIEQRKGFVAGLVGNLTGGLYTPMNVTVVCKGGSSVRLSPNDKNLLAATP